MATVEKFPQLMVAFSYHIGRIAKGRFQHIEITLCFPAKDITDYTGAWVPPANEVSFRHIGYHLTSDIPA